MKQKRMNERGSNGGRLVWIAATAVAVVAGIDTGSIVLTHLSVSDDVQEVGRATTAITEDKPVNQTIALKAFETATEYAKSEYDATVDKKSFRVNADTSVTLTIRKPVRTLVFKHIPPLQSYLSQTATITAQPLVYGSRS